jgi:hypothetical protein
VKSALHLLRRTHLYCGLLMLPWAVMYGVTAFLFNHPTAFSDQPYVEFSRETLADTPMATPPTPAEVAEQVVIALRANAQPGASYTLVEPEQACYTREFAFAVVRLDGQEINVLIDATGAGGSVRSREVPVEKPVEEAPFGRSGYSKPGRPLRRDQVPLLPNALHERVKEAIPAILERTGFPSGEVTVTSVPDLSFLMDAEGKRWRVTFNALTGAVAGRLLDDEPPPPKTSTRNFLLRLHTAHGYPYQHGSRWIWAVVVDVMAIVLVFWGLSGLAMWWQLRALRRSGAIVLALSTGAAVAIAIGMHAALTSL